MGSVVLSYNGYDNRNYQYAFESYEGAFNFLLQELRKNGEFALKMSYGKEGKGIYRHNNCLFAYGDDQCSELAGLTKITIAPDDDIDYDDEVVDYNQEEVYDDDDDDDDPDFDEDYYYDNDTKL